MKTTAKQEIIRYLALAPGPVPVRDMIIPNVSQNSIGTRLPEMAREGIVVGEKLNGKPYKSWRLSAKLDLL